MFTRSLVRLGAATAVFLAVGTVASMAQSGSDTMPVYALGENPTTDLTYALQVSAQFNERILQTVYWALGVVVTVLAVIMGFNWLVGMRSFERDREAMQATIAAELASLDSRLTSKVEEGLRSGTAGIAEAYSELGHKLNREIADLQEALRAHEIDTEKSLATTSSVLNEGLEKSINQLRAQIEATSKATQQAMRSADSGLHEQVTSVRDALSLFEMEMSAYRWKADDVPANEITYRVKYVLELIRREHSDYVIISQLERIEELIAKGAHRNSPDATNKLVNELPDKFGTYRSRLTGALSKPRGI